jgi:hypothetical protein
MVRRSGGRGTRRGTIAECYTLCVLGPRREELAASCKIVGTGAAIRNGTRVAKCIEDYVGCRTNSRLRPAFLDIRYGALTCYSVTTLRATGPVRIC